jgi:hypothetical protein
MKTAHHVEGCCLRTIWLDEPNHEGPCMVRRDFDSCAYQYEETNIICEHPRFFHNGPYNHEFVEPKSRFAIPVGGVANTRRGV